VRLPERGYRLQVQRAVRGELLRSRRPVLGTRRVVDRPTLRPDRGARPPGARAPTEKGPKAPSEESTMRARFRSVRSPRRLRPRSLLGLLALGGALLAGCASGGGSTSESTEGGRLCVTLFDYAEGRRFSLASESHTDRVAYYSQPRDDAGLKIQADEVVAALVDQMERRGFRRFATEGRAPASGGAVVTRALEIERGGQRSAWIVGKGSEADERRAFFEAMNEFFQLYNISQSYQVIENPGGRDVFDSGSRQLRQAR